MGTVHSFPLDLVPARILVDFELELLVWIGDFADLVVVGDEVAGCGKYVLGDACWEGAYPSFS